MIDPHARYRVSLWDNDDDHPKRSSWSCRLAARLLKGRATRLTFLESVAAVLTLYRAGWSEYSLLWERES